MTPTDTIRDASDVRKSAAMSSCGSYRYSLTRRWGDSDRMVVWIGLNPSTADAFVDDPTIRRMIGFAKSHDDASGIVVVNLFALRSPSPADLRKHRDPIGPDNDREIVLAIKEASRVVVCWGSDVMVGRRHLHVLKLIDQPFCLGHTRSGHPRHPLYVRGDQPFEEYRSWPT